MKLKRELVVSDRSVMPILVLVAILSLYCKPLRLEVEVVSMATSIAHGLAGPKAEGNANRNGGQ